MRGQSVDDIPHVLQDTSQFQQCTFIQYMECIMQLMKFGTAATALV